MFPYCLPLLRSSLHALDRRRRRLPRCVGQPQVGPVNMASSHAYERILIVKLSAIGDIIHTLSAVAALRHAYPKSWLAWIVEGAGASLLRGNSDLDELITIDTRA